MSIFPMQTDLDRGSTAGSNDPIEDGLHYVINMVPRDIYDFDENDEIDSDSYWCEPNEDGLSNLAQDSMQEIQLSRKDIPPLIVDASTNLHATEVLDSESCDDSDHDDTLWDWMTADDDEAD
ncbi:hypothetical protein E3N88_09350 [Mikania micrantha]|uniref:Uncharacterized protein n=1 Tax=Mikania micrantha TaxID=192012 RepID=A0A5N6PIV7_9ASTR|nr:hypothetical protein E3N88_09350 [Mikania micrantha]